MIASALADVFEYHWRGCSQIRSHLRFPQSYGAVFHQSLGETGFDYLVKHTDPTNVKFEMDCGWDDRRRLQTGTVS